MKYHPRYIVFWCVSKYMTEDEIEAFKKDIAKGNLTQDRRYLSTVKKHFNIERLLKEPILKEDVWVFNYLEYEVKSRFPKVGLIAKYEREIVLPIENTFRDFIKDVS